MNALVPKHAEHVMGEWSRWEHPVFRATLGTLCFVDGIMGDLCRAGVLLKDFGGHAQAMTGRLLEASLAAPQMLAGRWNTLSRPRLARTSTPEISHW